MFGHSSLLIYFFLLILQHFVSCDTITSASDQQRWKQFSFNRFILMETTRSSLVYDDIRDDEEGERPFFYYDRAPPICPSQKKASVNVLLIGDSIDRFIVSERCKSSGLSWKTWGEAFSYRVADGHTKDKPAIVCESNNFTLSFLNVYGSPLTGPYTAGKFVNNKEDPFTDTRLRISHGIGQYIRTFGKPDLIVYRSDIWDLKELSLKHLADWPHSRRVSFRNDTTSLYIQNMKAGFDIIRRALPETLLAIHTIPTIDWNEGYMQMFHQFQNANRYIAASLDIALYDFQMFLLHANILHTLRHSGKFQDHHHPAEIHSAAFGEVFIRSMRTFLCVGSS